ncbi:RNA polymerase sigma factor [Echinicola shivajiensis]|uniref:RNA polymerase sigma factor n=1 Tax=Echinicola shivajiensis TaxID=1035916 RepID=UPI001BFC58AF|nr:RNA polymerase sigma-70 factor [Echinicola shivajiensis]
MTCLIEDFQLVEKIKAHDEEAFHQLYQRYSPKIYRISKKMHMSHHDAEEIVQDVFLYLWDNKERLKSDLSINAFIFSIVRSLVIKKSQKKARFAAYQKYAIPLNQGYSTVTEDEIIFEDLYVYALEVISNLPQKQKEVFIMKNEQHLSAEEIASELDVSVRTVENQIYRATKSLRKQLETKHGVSYGMVIMFSEFLF